MTGPLSLKSSQRSGTAGRQIGQGLGEKASATFGAVVTPGVEAVMPTFNAIGQAHQDFTEWYGSGAASVAHTHPTDHALHAAAAPVMLARGTVLGCKNWLQYVANVVGGDKVNAERRWKMMKKNFAQAGKAPFAFVSHATMAVVTSPVGVVRGAWAAAKWAGRNIKDMWHGEWGAKIVAAQEAEKEQRVAERFKEVNLDVMRRGQEIGAEMGCCAFTPLDVKRFRSAVCDLKAYMAVDAMSGTVSAHLTALSTNFNKSQVGKTENKMAEETSKAFRAIYDKLLGEKDPAKARDIFQQERQQLEAALNGEIDKFKAKRNEEITKLGSDPSKAAEKAKAETQRDNGVAILEDRRTKMLAYFDKQGAKIENKIFQACIAGATLQASSKTLKDGWAALDVKPDANPALNDDQQKEEKTYQQAVTNFVQAQYEAFTQTLATQTNHADVHQQVADFKADLQGKVSAKFPAPIGPATTGGFVLVSDLGVNVQPDRHRDILAAVVTQANTSADAVGSQVTNELKAAGDSKAVAEKQKILQEQIGLCRSVLRMAALNLDDDKLGLNDAADGTLEEMQTKIKEVMDNTNGKYGVTTTIDKDSSGKVLGCHIAISPKAVASMSDAEWASLMQQQILMFIASLNPPLRPGETIKVTFGGSAQYAETNARLAKYAGIIENAVRQAPPYNGKVPEGQNSCCKFFHNETAIGADASISDSAIKANEAQQKQQKCMETTQAIQGTVNSIKEGEALLAKLNKGTFVVPDDSDKLNQILNNAQSTYATYHSEVSMDTTTTAEHFKGKESVELDIAQRGLTQLADFADRAKSIINNTAPPAAQAALAVGVADATKTCDALAADRAKLATAQSRSMP